MTSTHRDVWVCGECYFAHHYGAYRAAICPNGTTIPLPFGDPPEHAHVGWFTGDSDTHTDREPLALLPEVHYVADNTDGETGDGIHDFSWSQCDGCGSNLGGARYRLAVTKPFRRWNPSTAIGWEMMSHD